MKKIYFLFSLLCAVGIYGQSNLLIENFEYTAGTDLTANGWNQSGATVTNPIKVSSAGLTWAGYIGSAIGNAASVVNNGQDVNRPLPSTISSGVVYASFLLKPGGEVAATTENYFFHFCEYTTKFTAINGAHRARTFIIRGTNPATQFKLGLNFNAAAFNSPSNVTDDLDITKTYLVVVKYNFVDGETNDKVSLFVFPEGTDISTLATEPATPTLGPFTASLTGTAPNQVLAPDLTIQGISLRQNAANQNAIVDGIYVRNVWDLTNATPTLNIEKFAKNNSIKVYPNPVTNKKVTIATAFQGKKEVTLFDLNGKKIFSKTISSNELELNSVGSGVYFLKTQIGNDSSVTKLLVK